MSKASELYENFKHSPLDGFKFQKELFNMYRYGVRTPEFIEEVFSVIENSLRNNTHDFMWDQFFVSDRDMYKRITLLNTRLLAESSLKDYLPETQARDVLLKMIAGTAYASCSRDNDDSIINLDVKNVWLDVFKDVPEFISALDKQLAYWSDWHISTREQYADYYAGIEAHKNRPVAAEYILTVPISLKSNYLPCSDGELLMNSGTYQLINEIVDKFNDFGIEGYMDDFGKKCINSSATFSDGFIFKFECCECLSVDELRKLHADFLGQLSDGWGENMSQRTILIDDKLVSIDFETDHANQFVCIKSELNITPAI